MAWEVEIFSYFFFGGGDFWRVSRFVFVLGGGGGLNGLREWVVGERVDGERVDG